MRGRLACLSVRRYSLLVLLVAGGFCFAGVGHANAAGASG